MSDPALSMREFGAVYLGGKSARDSEEASARECIPHYRDRQGSILVKQSDADAWRDARMIAPENQPSDLKSMLQRIAEEVLSRRATHGRK